VNLNKLFIAGNLTRDCELRYTPSGTAVGEFGLAINRQWKGKDGQERKEVTFVDVTAWGRVAEVVAEYCKKGSPLFVEGRLQLDTWEKDGQKRSKLKVVAENVQFIGGKAGGDQGRPGSSTPEASAPGATPPADGAKPVDDSIPF
jgi:single-strand DNA-binding protein